jgi:hypothetical protein
VDSNQGEIVAALRKVGAVVIPVTGDVRIGFDLLAAWGGRLYALEVKDGSKPPSARRLTPGEQARAQELSAVGVPLHVVETPEQALQILGLLTSGER